MPDHGIFVSISIDGQFRYLKTYKRDTLVSRVRTEAIKKLKMTSKQDDLVLHSKGQNRALVEYNDVVEDEVRGKAVTVGQLAEKRYSSDGLSLEFVMRESAKKVFKEKMARLHAELTARDAVRAAGGAAGGAAAAPVAAGSKRKVCMRPLLNDDSADEGNDLDEWEEKRFRQLCLCEPRPDSTAECTCGCLVTYTRTEWQQHKKKHGLAPPGGWAAWE